MSYTDILLTNEDYIKSNSVLNDNTAGEYILPAIYIAQRQGLEEIIGTALTRKIQQLVDNNTIEDNDNKHYLTLLNDYIQDYLTYAAICEVIVAISFKLNNFGASRTEDEKQYNVTYAEVFNLRDYYKGKADYFAYRLQRYLIANYTNYPELVEYKTIADLRCNLYSAAGCSIWLGGSRGAKTNYDKPTLEQIYNFPSSTNKK